MANKQKKTKSGKTSTTVILLIVLALLIAACAAIILHTRSGVKDLDFEYETYEPVDYSVEDGVPVYSDVEKSIFDKSLFKKGSDGRMTYDGKPCAIGVDVSEFQGDIDWQAVYQDGIRFAYIRAGFRGYGAAGVMVEDENFRTNIKKARKAGLQVGVYFYSQALTAVEAKEEADFLLRIISGYEMDLPVMYDWENYGDGMRTDDVSVQQLTVCATTFCRRMEQYGYQAGVYYNLTDAYERYDLSKLADRYTWFAQYNVTPDLYYRFDIWQYTDNGTVKGIKGGVDLNAMLIEPK